MASQSDFLVPPIDILPLSLGSSHSNVPTSVDVVDVFGDGRLRFGAEPGNAFEWGSLVEDMNVRRVVRCLPSLPSPHLGLTPGDRGPAFELLHIPIDDDPRADIGPFLAPAVAFIAGSLAAGHNVFVHCQAGRSRSAAIVLAALVAGAHPLAPPMQLGQAFARLRVIRPLVDPNVGFMKALVAYERTLSEQRSTQLTRFTAVALAGPASVRSEPPTLSPSMGARSADTYGMDADSVDTLPVPTYDAECSIDDTESRRTSTADSSAGVVTAPPPAPFDLVQYAIERAVAALPVGAMTATEARAVLESDACHGDPVLLQEATKRHFRQTRR